jgi:hypothetical protein
MAANGRRLRPSYIVVQPPGHSAYSFKLDDKGALRANVRSGRYVVDPAFPVRGLPVYQVVNDKIYWGTDATDSPQFLIDPPRTVPPAPPPPPPAPMLEVKREEVVEGPIRQFVPPAPQFRAPRAGPAQRPATPERSSSGIAVYNPDAAQANRFVAAASPFNPNGPFHPSSRPY